MGGFRGVVAIALGVLVLLCPGTASPHSFASKAFPTLVAEADHIFLGTVSAVTPERLSNGAIVSHVALSDVSTVKGDAPPHVLTVLGGTIDGEGMRLAGIPEFRVHQRYLLFERRNGRDAFPFVGGVQGVFRISSDASGTAVVHDAHGLLILVDASFDRSLSSPVPLTLEMFLTAIRRRITPGS